MKKEKRPSRVALLPRGDRCSPPLPGRMRLAPPHQVPDLVPTNREPPPMGAVLATGQWLHWKDVQNRLSLGVQSSVFLITEWYRPFIAEVWGTLQPSWGNPVKPSPPPPPAQGPGLSLPMEEVSEFLSTLTAVCSLPLPPLALSTPHSLRW